jgi:hypothetical protein
MLVVLYSNVGGHVGIIPDSCVLISGVYLSPRSVTLADFAIMINYCISVFIFALRTSVESYLGCFSVVKRDKEVSACFIKIK